MSDTSEHPQEVCNKLTKMWIVDVLNAPANHPTEEHAIAFLNRYLRKVQLAGVVTSCRHTGSRTQFNLDDGTGSIVCTINYDSINQKTDSMDQLTARLKVLGENATDQAEKDCVEAMSVLAAFIDKRMPYHGEIKVGQHHAICGFVSNYFEDRRVNAFRVSQPLTEYIASVRMVLMAKLYKQEYLKEDEII